MNVLDLINITQTYKDKQGKDYNLFTNFNLSIEDVPNKGQFIGLMGESGCGKSTLLRYITSLQKPTSGQVLINGNIKLPSVPMVFQTPSSLEWYSVLDNVALPLTMKGVDKKIAKEKAMEMIKVVGLEGHENKYAKAPQLSGGQLQRVAIARSLVANPSMIVFDEPLAAIDLPKRRKLQEFLYSIFLDFQHKGIDSTFIFVTHDPVEAVYLANDIIIMGNGVIKSRFPVDIEKDRKSAKFMEIVNYIENTI